MSQRKVRYTKFVGVGLEEDTYTMLFKYAEWRKSTVSQIIRHIVTQHFRSKEEE